MLWTLFITLLLVWFLAVIGSYTMGGFVHVLLGLAVVALVIQLTTSKPRPPRKAIPGKKITAGENKFYGRKPNQG